MPPLPSEPSPEACSFPWPLHPNHPSEMSLIQTVVQPMLLDLLGTCLTATLGKMNALVPRTYLSPLKIVKQRENEPLGAQ